MTAGGSWRSRFKEQLVEKMNRRWWATGSIPLCWRVLWRLLRLGGA